MSRRSLAVIFSIIIAVLVAVLIGGIGLDHRFRSRAAGRIAYELAESREYPAAEVRSLELVLADEDAIILPGDGDQVRVERWAASRDEDHRMYCDNRQGVLEVRTDTRWFGRGWFRWFTGPGDRIIVSVPRAASLQVGVEAGAGDVEVRDLHLSHVDLSSGSGNIDIDSVEAEGGVLHSGAGDIAVLGSVLGSLQASTGAGDVDVEASAAEQANLESSSGDISFAGTCTGFEARSGAGNISGEFRGPAERLSATTAAGDVDLVSLEAGTLRQITASSSAGDISVGLPQGSRISLQSGTSGIQFDESAAFELGTEGAVRIDAHTAAGEVELHAV